MISFGKWTMQAALICLGSLVFLTHVSWAISGPSLPLPPRVKVWIEFIDKGPDRKHTTRPITFASQKDFENLPVYEPYIDRLRVLGVVCSTRLKWQNLISATVDLSKVAELQDLFFVSRVSLFPLKAKLGAPLPEFDLNWPKFALAKSTASQIYYGAGFALMDSLNVNEVHEWLAKKGAQPGQGMRIAIIDADFHLGASFYNELTSQNKIIDQWDFVSNKPQSVDLEIKDSHGAQCLSLIGGNVPGTLVGVAPKAEFLLYRAEDNNHETFVEEDYVAAAIERAVDSGAQVISISLGYRYEFDDSIPDLAFSQFDGRTRPASIAALGAARRNVLVSVAMGNLSSDINHIPSTPSLTSPADADSILGVGIADAKRRRCSYSCTGPTSDGRVKPDVASLGLGNSCTVNVANTSKNGAKVSQLAGTSFAAPVVAGIGALLLQCKPGLSAQGVRQALIQTSDRALNPDSGLGNGVLDAWAALRVIQGEAIPYSVQDDWLRLYHAGERAALAIPWEWGRPLPRFELVDVQGKKVKVNLRVTGPFLQIIPVSFLRTGVYLAHVW